jgi:transcriptional regulator with XRE-family HTH domain
MGHHSSVDYDWKRLGNALLDARNGTGMSREQFAAHSGVSVSTIKHLELAYGFSRWPKSIGPIEVALGKAEGWARSIALGTDGPDLRTRSEDAPSPRGLPEGVRQVLAEGATLGATIYDLPGRGPRVRVVVVAQLEHLDSEEKVRDIRTRNEEWLRVQPELRKLIEGGSESSSGE